MVLTSDKRQHTKTIRKTCFTANIVYLALHVFYLALFCIARFDVLIYVDVAAIVFYLTCFALLQKGKFYIYALACGNFFFAFVSVATIMLGFSSGFALLLIGLSVVSFFTTYFSQSKNFKGSISWVILSFAIYLALYFITKYNKPYYAVEPWMETTLLLVHSAASFAFVMNYMTVFVRYALSLEKKILGESRTDELTQINNRYGLFDYFDAETNKSGHVLALFDIDDFKKINDQYGHAAGDYVLKKVADIAKRVFGDSFLCRYGGEEFVIVMDGQGALSPRSRLEELRLSVEQEMFEFEGNALSITLTIGAAIYDDDRSLDQWVERADAKMYWGKNNGKNKVVF